MDKGIFRDKSIQKVSSPEQLDRYVKAGSRGYLVLLTAIILLLAGTLLWASVGKLETKTETGCAVLDGTVYCLLNETDGVRINTEHAMLRIQNQEYADLTVSGPMLTGTTGVDERLIRSEDMDAEDWCYLITCKTDLADDIYRCVTVLDTVSPLKLIFN